MSLENQTSKKKLKDLTYAEERMGPHRPPEDRGGGPRGQRQEGRVAVAAAVAVPEADRRSGTNLEVPKRLGSSNRRSSMDVSVAWKD